MHILSLVHGEDARAELFAPLTAAAGHQLDEWSFSTGSPPPRPLESYHAVLVFGGSTHPDQDGRYAWLRKEVEWLSALIERPVPTLGICLGSQLLARAAGAWIAPLERPELGWHDVELTDEGAMDPVLSAFPTRFEALQWHYYEHGLPEGAVALARNPTCLQGFRLGESCWGVQFHPEVTEPQLGDWIAEDAAAAEQDRLRNETRERIGMWNELGRRLCGSFLAAAERLVPGAG
jgi:GMP synthase-like glutamine amidotransferase